MPCRMQGAFSFLDLQFRTHHPKPISYTLDLTQCQMCVPIEVLEPYAKHSILGVAGK